MELGLFSLSAGLFLLGIYRYLLFRYRLRKYERTKAEVINFDVESRYFSSDGTEITRAQFENKAWLPAFWKKVDYYSPEINYTANDGEQYTGTWWTEMPGKLPYNIGERIEIYFHPETPRKFFLYDKMMMFWEPMLMMFVGAMGMGFMFRYLF